MSGVSRFGKAVLVADRERYLFIIAAAFGEDWTNPAAMHKTYVETDLRSLKQKEYFLRVK